MKTLVANLVILAPLGLGLPGCGGQSSGKKIEDLPIKQEINLPGLEAAVEVVTDNRGMPHIFASSEHDAILVEGYLMARDRMAQMEFYRRALQGTMCEIISPALAPSLVDQDIGARQLGFHRMAKDILATLGPEDQTRKILEAFSQGINLYIAKLRSDEEDLPAGLGGLIPVEKIADWTPSDTLTIARYMSYDLSKAAGDEVSLTLARQGVATAFPADSPDPRLKARAGLFQDFWSFAPVEKVYSREGFPNAESDSGSRAWWRPKPPQSPPSPPVMPANKLRAARDWFRRMEALGLALRGFGGGSNNWAVHGSKTASGRPMLMSDPHLALDSPNFFWYVHLNTARAGGDLNASGLALFGCPGLLLGYNDKIAWGLTVTNFDVDDVYLEEILPAAGGQPDRVLFRGQQVPIEVVEETVHIIGQADRVIPIEFVPHHGPIIPGTHAPGGSEALSRRWAGLEPSNELAAVMGMLKAGSIEEVEAALDAFAVGSQNWMVALASGDIFWSTQSRVPLRDPRALTYDAESGGGMAPCFVLPGNGDYEWTGSDLSDRYLPHAESPAAGFIATANQDPVGVSDNGNPFDDQFYLGWDFDKGFRQARIVSRLQELAGRGGITPEEMSELQGDDFSPLGSRLTAALVNAAGRALEEKAQPGTHPDLSTLVAAESARMDKLAAMRDRLAAWTSFRTPAAVEGTPSASEIADSVAATLFNVTVPRLVHLAFDDEVSRVGEQPSSQQIARLLLQAVLAPEQLHTYDAQLQDTVLWDDLDTAEETESRDERLVRAMLEAIAWLEQKFGSEANEWRWGKLHTVRLEDITGLFGNELSIPPEDDQQFPNGFPRHGDNFGVDASNYSIWSREDFRYFSGPQQRLVVEVGPGGPRIWNSRPGGQTQDSQSPHFADDVEFWRKNQAPPLFFSENDIVLNAESRIRYLP